DNDPVDILITMAAVDANTHQEVGIMQIVNLFEDEANFDRLRAMNRCCSNCSQLIQHIGSACILKSICSDLHQGCLQFY
ncbi:hypothetical protein MJL33_29920, partial [Salmonella enterica subsp. enterica serovar Kentucky]|nr:hypothetical protein [Salmonella enterica subsp. enterica serovar Kentucky]